MNRRKLLSGIGLGVGSLIAGKAMGSVLNQEVAKGVPEYTITLLGVEGSGEGIPSHDITHYQVIGVTKDINGKIAIKTKEENN